MAHRDIDTVFGWRGRTIIDRNGVKIGKFEDLYLDAETERPDWAAVKTGLLGMKQHFVPLTQAEEVGDDIQVPFEAEQVKGAPSIDPGTKLSNEDEDLLHRHYGMSGAGAEAGGLGGAGAQGSASRGGSLEGAGMSGAEGGRLEGAGVGGAEGGRTGAEEDTGLVRERQGAGAGGGHTHEPGVEGIGGGRTAEPAVEGAGGGRTAEPAVEGAGGGRIQEPGVEGPAGGQTAGEGRESRQGEERPSRMRKYVVTRSDVREERIETDGDPS